MALQCMCSGVYLRYLLRPLWSCIVYSGNDWNLLHPRLNISGSFVFNILSYQRCFLKQAFNIPTDVLANRCDLQSLFSHKMLARAERWNWLKEVKQCATPFVHVRGLHHYASVVCYMYVCIYSLYQVWYNLPALGLLLVWLVTSVEGGVTPMQTIWIKLNQVPIELKPN